MTSAVAPGQDPTEELGERLQKAAIAVRELKLVMPTLEEYFYAITDGSEDQGENVDDDDGAFVAAVPGPEEVGQ